MYRPSISYRRSQRHWKTIPNGHVGADWCLLFSDFDHCHQYLRVLYHLIVIYAKEIDRIFFNLNVERYKIASLKHENECCRETPIMNGFCSTSDTVYVIDRIESFMNMPFWLRWCRSRLKAKNAKSEYGSNKESWGLKYNTSYGACLPLGRDEWKPPDVS